MKKKLASIIITNYNKEKYLKKSITTAIKQSYNQKEIIIYDDSSTDNSINIIRKFKSIKLIKNRNKKKLSKPLNQINAIVNAFKKCKGQYIFFLDSDDYFKKKKIISIIKKFDNDNELQFMQDTPSFMSKKNSYKVKLRRKNYFSIWPRFYPTSTIAIKKSFFINFLKFIEINKYPNLEIDARICIYAYLKNQFNITEKIFTFYNNDPHGITSNYNKYGSNWWKKRYEAYAYMFTLMKKLKIKIVKGPDFYLTYVINKLLIYKK
jgi:glycosyltransferase involved in cell wall biosynthesis